MCNYSVVATFLIKTVIQKPGNHGLIQCQIQGVRWKQRRPYGFVRNTSVGLMSQQREENNHQLPPPPPNVDVICVSVQEHFLHFHVKYLDEKELRMFQTDDVGKDVVELCLECIYLTLYFKNKIKKQ